MSRPTAALLHAQHPAGPGRLNSMATGLIRTLLAITSGLFLAGNALAQDSDMPQLPLPQESIASEQPSPSAHLFLRELSKRQQEWNESKGRYTMLANLFPAVLEQEGVVYNMEANGEWLLQNGLLVFQVLDDYRREYDVLAWEQDRVWSVNSSGEIGSRSRLEMDEIAREILDIINTSEDSAYSQARTYLSLAELTRYNTLPAEEFRPIYTSLGYQVARPAQGVLLLHRAGKESSAQRNMWYGAVAFGGSCAWVQESGGRMRIMPYMNSSTEGVESIVEHTLAALVAAQTRYKGAYQHYGELKDLSGLYFERLDFSGQLPATSSGIVLSFKLDDDKLGYSAIAELGGVRLYTDQAGEINAFSPEVEGGENYLPLPGPKAMEGFMPDQEGPVEPEEGLDKALANARLELVAAVLNHAHNAQEAHLIRHGNYASLRQLKEDGLLELDELESDNKGTKDGVQLSLKMAEDSETYEFTGQAGDVIRTIDQAGELREALKEADQG